MGLSGLTGGDRIIFVSSLKADISCRKTTLGFFKNLRILRCVNSLYPYFNQYRNDHRAGSRDWNPSSVPELRRQFSLGIHNSPVYLPET